MNGKGPRQKTQQRGERLEDRVSRDVKALCQKAAVLQGRSPTDFVVNSALEAAKKSIREKEFLDLSHRDRTAFVEALLKTAPEPNARLLRAARRHQELLAR